jgi:hypothetical protein
VVAADSSLRLSAAQLIANDLQELVKAGPVSGAAAQHQLLLADVTGAQDLSMLDGALFTTALFSSNQTIDAAKLTRVDAISFGSNTLTLNAASADQLQNRFVDSASGHLEITGYSGENVSSLNTKAASIDLNVAGVQSISAAAAPANATLTITGTALVEAADAAALKSRLVNGNASGSNPGEVRVLNYTNQDLTVGSGVDLSRSQAEGLKLTVQVSAAADISTISDNYLADADEINIAAGGSLTLSTAQALDSNLLVARVQGVSGGSLTITGYNGENLGDIAPAAGDLAINFVLSIGGDGDLRSIAVADLLAFTADADSITIPEDETLQLTAEQAFALKGKLLGDGALEITNYAGQDLSVDSGFGNLVVAVDLGSAAVDLTAADLADALLDVGQIRLSGNDQLTINEAQAVALADRFVASAPSGEGEVPARIMVKGYQGADLSGFADDQAGNITLKLFVDQNLDLRSKDLAELADVDSVIVSSSVSTAHYLTLNADQAAFLADRLQGPMDLQDDPGLLTIEGGYTNQDLSGLSDRLTTTLNILAGEVAYPNEADLFDGSLGVDAVQLFGGASLTLNGYTGFDLDTKFFKVGSDNASTLAIKIDRPSDVTTGVFKVDLSDTAVGGAEFLELATSIEIGPDAELLIDNAECSAGNAS